MDEDGAVHDSGRTGQAVIDELREELRLAHEQQSFKTTVEDVSSDEEESSFGEDGDDDMWDWDAAELEEVEYDEDEDVYSTDMGAWDRLHGRFMQEVAELENQLSDEDKAILRAFAFHVKNNLSEEAFAELPQVFPAAGLPSLHKIKARLTFLSGVNAQYYDCCINSCMAYTGPFADLNECAYCRTSRLDSYGKARRQFMYVPMESRLAALYLHRGTAEKMLYRADYLSDSTTTSDIFDGSHYKDLCSRFVTVEGRQLDHQFFADRRDIALGLSSDGFAPWRRRKKTAWPIILYNYNLPPEIRFHKNNIIPLCVVPGPKKPKDFDSFLWPAVEELLRLAVGVPAFDSTSLSPFSLHAYLVLVSGDMPAVSMIMQMKGHNGLFPCRMCTIRGLPIPDSRNHAHYVPLHRQRHPAVQENPGDFIAQYSGAALPLRTHEQYLTQAREVMRAPTNAEAERRAKACGIKGLPLLSHLPSLSFPHSFPFDFMHLIWENLVPNLVALWTGQFKGLGEGHGQYEFTKTVWDAIGEATARSGDTLPSIFGPRLGDISQDRSACTADAWSLWTLYIAPVLLRSRFLHARYYSHFVSLVELLNLCLQFEVSTNEIQAIRSGFIDWVQKYEKYYYQYSPDRMATCPVTIHALLHIADGIEVCGPVWTTWAFPMERFCGTLQPAIKSRRHPWSSINNRILALSRLNQVKLKYGLHEELSLRPPADENVRHGELHDADYPTCVLMPPHRRIDPDKGLLDKLVGCLVTRFDARPGEIRNMVCRDVDIWGKVRILPDGDTAHAAALAKLTQDRRDQTYVRVYVDKHTRRRKKAPEYELSTFYGRLEHIISLRFESAEALRILGVDKHTTVFLAAIKSCAITSSHPRLDIHYYSQYGPLSLVDITCSIAAVLSLELSLC
ncbi:hypothetical protein BN946_scf184939.g68 [Trametes cinnabarina]|uniref:Transposase family Tnp2 protein n=1 Tax=Pycnoporus cinnabarinus TaxID=5643 RepID=A0A060SI15_PYCCI|nr:hypothetical protein BN946_scf184939.g68 [Trametes cinnabarina]